MPSFAFVGQTETQHTSAQTGMIFKFTEKLFARTLIKLFHVSTSKRFVLTNPEVGENRANTIKFDIKHNEIKQT